jgi:hypothetical protein
MRTVLVIVAILSFLFGLDAMAKPYCKPCPYSCDGLALGKGDCKELGQIGALCCLELSRRGLRQVVQQEQVSRQPGDSRPLLVTPPRVTRCQKGRSGTGHECALASTAGTGR